MGPEPVDPAAFVAPRIQVERPAVPDAPQPPAEAAPAPPEDVRALDAVFASRPEGPSALPALLGLWSAGMLAHDLAADHLARPEEEDEPEGKDRPEG